LQAGTARRQKYLKNWRNPSRKIESLWEKADSSIYTELELAEMSGSYRRKFSLEADLGRLQMSVRIR